MSYEKKNLDEFMKELAEKEKPPLFLRIIHWIFARCFFGEHWWKEPTKESSLAECAKCGYKPVCRKHGCRMFVHGYEYKLGCTPCRDEAHAEYLKRPENDVKKSGIATDTEKPKQGMVFYTENVTKEEMTASGWKRSVYCRVHEKENVACGCIRFVRVETIDGNDVFLNTRINPETMRPRTLGFEVVLNAGSGEVSYGDYREVYSNRHFDKLYHNFVGQAKALIDRYGKSH